jgi:hypothetical protein
MEKNDQVYALEDSAYASLGIAKKWEVPIDLLLYATTSTLMIFFALWLAVYAKGPGTGVLGALGGGRIADAIIPVAGGIFAIVMCRYQWNERKARQRA